MSVWVLPRAFLTNDHSVSAQIAEAAMDHHTGSTDAHSTSRHPGNSHYRRLGIMTVLSFIAMYFLMYAMVNAVDNVYMNFNQVYMAGLMAAPMVLIELAVMRSMYHNKRLNALLAGAAVVAAVLFFLFIRRQTAIGDRQFLRSMIPHHAGAILMCNQAPLRDADIKRLCQNILSSQQAEIDQMKGMLREKRN
jgi:cation transport ATPase